MSVFFNTSINIHHEKERDISVTECFSELYNSVLVVEKITKTKQVWYLTDYSRKNASEYIVFDGNKPFENIYSVFDKRYKKNFPLINESIWNGQPDGQACSITHYMKFILDPRKSNVLIDIDEMATNSSDMIDSLLLLSQRDNRIWIMVDSKGYWLHEKNVFPDRVYVGWMLYLPHKILPELVPEAAQVVPVMNGDTQKGTIIVSTNEIFDGSKKEHIEKANDIEIRLLDLGYLPLMTEL